MNPNKLLDAIDAVDAAIEAAEQKALAGELTTADIQTILELVEEQGQIVHHLIGQPYVTHFQRVFSDKVWGAPQWEKRPSLTCRNCRLYQ